MPDGQTRTEIGDLEQRIDELQSEIARLEKDRAELAKRVTKLEDAISFSSGGVGGVDRYDQAVLELLANARSDTFQTQQLMMAYRDVGIKDRSKIKNRVKDLKRVYGEHVGEDRWRFEAEDVEE